MSKRNLIAKLYRLLSGPLGHDTDRLLQLEQSLKDTSELLENRIEEVKGLRKHLHYLHNIYLHRNNCRFRIEFDNTKNARLHLITTSFDTSWLNVIIYIPHEQMEIASLCASTVDGTLVIVDIKIDIAQCDMAVGRFLLQELAAQAKVHGLHTIKGQFRMLPGITFSALTKFYKTAGFDVSENEDEGTGLLVYSLNA